MIINVLGPSVNSEAKKIDVSADIPLNMAGENGTLIDSIASTCGFPPQTPEKMYTLFNKSTQKDLNSGMSLQDNGIKETDILKMRLDTITG